MAIYRTVQLSFWTDEYVLDNFTPEDKFFYLYLLTNPQTNLCGCYQLSWTTTIGQLGYNKETILRLIDRFENVHKLIKYCSETKEILLLNWHKYNWTKSPDFIKGLEKHLVNVKCAEFREYLENVRCNNTVYRPSQDGQETSVTVTVTDTVSVTDTVTDIISYLNSICNTNYKSNTKNTIKHIKARLNEGYTVEDFKTVIDKKYGEWTGTEMEQYLRPATLFGTKFESYLNQKIVGNRISNRVSEVDNWV